MQTTTASLPAPTETTTSVSTVSTQTAETKPTTVIRTPVWGC